MTKPKPQRNPVRARNKARSRVTIWETKGPARRSISVSFVDHFDARGMRPVYGRGDHFGRRALQMDVWRTATGRIVARFWSRSSEVDGESYEVSGYEIPAESLRSTLGDNEHLIPECLRDAYDNWVVSEMPFID